MKRAILAGVISAAALLSTTAQAAEVFTLSGTLDNGQSWGSFLVPMDPGSYLFNFSLTQPAVIHLEFVGQIHEVDYQGGKEIGGDERLSFFDVDTNGSQSGNMEYRLPLPYSGLDLGGDIYRSYRFQAESMSFWLTGTNGSPVTYSMSFQAIPEPATWAMMIVGLGLAGSVLRRSRNRAVEVNAVGHA